MSAGMRRESWNFRNGFQRFAELLAKVRGIAGVTDPSGLVYRDIPQTDFDLQFSYSGPYIVATYDTNDKQLSAMLSESNSDAVCISLSNSGGLISKIMLFRISSLENPAPAADPLQIIRQ